MRHAKPLCKWTAAEIIYEIKIRLQEEKHYSSVEALAICEEIVSICSPIALKAKCLRVYGYTTQGVAMYFICDDAINNILSAEWRDSLAVMTKQYDTPTKERKPYMVKIINHDTSKRDFHSGLNGVIQIHFGTVANGVFIDDKTKEVYPLSAPGIEIVIHDNTDNESEPSSK